MNFLINAAFEDAASIRGGAYFTFPFSNAVFIGGRRLKEEIRYMETPVRTMFVIQDIGCPMKECGRHFLVSPETPNQQVEKLRLLNLQEVLVLHIMRQY